MGVHPQPGDKIGRWTVGEDYILTAKGERKYLCRCECGTQRYVLERSLKYGESLSCGCLRKEEARKAVAHDLTGKRFGDLTVIGRSRRPPTDRGIFWHCKCSCGNTCEVLSSLLVIGRKTHCGCKTVRRRPKVDITGKVFGKLTALYPTEKRSPKGSVIWHCRCECGKEIDASSNDLMYGNLKSCGCQKKEHDGAAGTSLTHIDGTNLERIRDTRPQANNTTGYKGVYLINGKYVAKIVFQRHAYYLGRYTDIKDAAQARRKAEEAVFGKAVPFYAAWLQRAEEDPVWAKENPASVKVKRGRGERLYLEMRPQGLRATRR